MAVAVLTAAAAAGFGTLTPGAAEPVVLTIMAVLATLGVFFVLGLLAGHFHIGSRGREIDLLRAGLNGIASGVMLTRPDGEVVTSNQALGALLGVTSAGELNPFLARAHGDGPSAEAIFRLALASSRGEPACEDVVWVTPPADGSAGQQLVLNVAVTRAPAVPGSNPPYALWTVTDVTALRAASWDTSSALAASSDLFEQAPLPQMIVSGEGEILRLNRRLRSWLDVKIAGASEPHHVSDLLATEDPSGLAELLRATTEQPALGEGLEAEGVPATLVRSDGGLVSVRLWLRRLESSGAAVGPAALGLQSAHDLAHDLAHNLANGPDIFILTLAKHTSASLSGPSAPVSSLARAFDLAPLGLATVDHEGRFVHVNPAFTRLMARASTKSRLKGKPQGLSARGIERKLASDVLARGADEKARAAVAGLLDRALAGSAIEGPLDIVTGEAQDFTRRVFVTQISDGGPEALILTVIDASEQKALEHKFAQSQKMEAVGTLAGGIAHDFNNVLTVIIGSADLLLQTLRPGDPAHKNVMNIKSSASRAADIVAQLLSFARKQTLQLKVLKVSSVLTEAALLLKRALGERIEVKIQEGRDLWDVKADQTQLQQVLMNLSLNARDAMAQGGRLTFRTRNISERESQRVQAQGMPVGEYVLIEVEDTGHGMRPDVMAKIFEPFFTTKGIGKGTGLGLSMVYGIVKQSGGYVFCQSQPGKGTSFQVYLPRYETTAQDELALAVPERPARRTDLSGTGRVLLVEDEDHVRGYAVDVLRRQGYEVIEACSGAEALEMVEAGLPDVDLVVSDVIMPEMDGPSLLKALRKRKPDLKFIFMSGYPDDAFRTTLEPGTKFAFLQKPFSLAQFAAKVKDELHP